MNPISWFFDKLSYAQYNRPMEEEVKSGRPETEEAEEEAE